MADYFNSRVQIGGEITLGQLKKIMDICDEEGGDVEGIGRDDLEDIESLQSILEDECGLFVSDNQARFGQQVKLTDYLRSEKIPFIEEQEGKYEYNAVALWFDGNELREVLQSQSGEPVVSMEVVKKAVALIIESGSVADVLEMLRKELIDPVLPDVRIVEGESIFRQEAPAQDDCEPSVSPR